MSSGREEIAEAIRGRREELGLTQAELATRAGVSTGTVQSLEGSRGAWDNPRSLPKIERALGWGPKSADRIRNGEAPILLEEGPQGPDRAVVDRSQMPVGQGIDPELLVEIAEATPDELLRVRGFLAGLKANRQQQP